MSIIPIVRALFPGSWIAYLAFGVGLMIAGATLGSKTQLFFDQPKIDRAEKNEALAKSQFGSVVAELASYHAQVEKDRADANQKALDESSVLRNRINDLQKNLTAMTQARQRTSNQLLEALRNAPQADASPLGPAARLYFDRVREQQKARVHPPSPAAGSPDGQSLP